MNRTLLNPGDIVGGRYQVDAYIDAGGMQEVYRATDVRLRRSIALKVPKNPSAERRFERSAVLSARVNHPNVAKTLDYGVAEGYPYLVEELIAGTTLAEFRAQYFVMDPALVAHILHHTVKAVAAAHKAGVCHRDLKPSNLLVSKGLEASSLKITDFGIAKMAEEEMAEAAATDGGMVSTQSRTALGAIPYMAPEMIDNPRTSRYPADVWAVGAMCYELLYGDLPFGAGWKAIKSILEAKEPPAPRTIAHSVQFRFLVDELQRLISACMTPDQAARPTSQALAATCADLCYSVFPRTVGRIGNKPYTSYGFMTVGGTTVFFNEGSVYGDRPSIGDRVAVSTFVGAPHPRAHPVVRLR